MKITFCVPLFIILLCTQLNSSCVKLGGPCEEPNDVRASSIAIDIIDQSSGRYIYDIGNPIYSIDSLIFYTTDLDTLNHIYWENLSPTSNIKYFRVSVQGFYNDLEDQSSFVEEKCKNIVIRYSETTIDTITICFKSKHTSCGSYFESLKVKKAGIEISSSKNTIGALILLQKS